MKFACKVCGWYGDIDRVDVALGMVECPQCGSTRDFVSTPSIHA